jgi:hypothetical protein
MTNQPNQQELRERYRQSRAKSLALFAAIDARRRAESQHTDLDTAHKSRSHDDDQLRRDVETDTIDDLAQWKADSDARQAAREHETRARARLEAEITHAHRQRSDAITGLRRDVAQHGADLVDAMKAVNTMARATAEQFDQMGAEITVLRERLSVAEAKTAQAESRQRELQADVHRAMTAAAVAKSELADVRVELRAAIFDRRIGDTPMPASVKEVN